MSHETFSKLSKSARNSHFIVFLPCFHLLHVYVHTNCLNLFTLVQFHTVTMPGEEVAEPPAKISTLPFIPPSFDWNASYLYSQFRLFKMKVEFAFKGTYAKNPGHAKVGAILNLLGDAAFEIYCNFTCPEFMVRLCECVIGLKVKEVAIVITVVPATLQSIVLLTENFVIIVIKRDTSSLFVGVTSIASLVPDGREVRAKVDQGRINMKFHSVIKLMIAVGTHTSRTLFRLCTIKVFVEISLTFVLMR